MTKPLILVDGSSYFFRAFHALPPLTNSKGQPTGAVYGVTNMIRRLLKDHQPEYIAVVFDAKGKTFRDELYPEYKAHRPHMPVELSSQFQPLIEVLTAFGLPILTVTGVEADDVIGTLARQAAQEGLSVLISTGDKDMAQLVNQQVTLINTMSNQVLTIEGVQEKFGVRPDQIIDYLTLVGDTSDNIPGVTKCGPKTAVKWLNQYQTLDELLKHMDDISGKIGEYLRQDQDKLPLSKQLVTIKTDVPLPISITDLKLRDIQNTDLLKLAELLEFRTWIKEFSPKVEPSNEPINKSMMISALKTNKEILDWFQLEADQTLFALSFEIGPKKTLLSATFGTRAGRQAHIDLNADPNRLESLKPFLENHTIKKLGHDLKQIYLALKKQNITLNGIAYDTMLESYLLNSIATKHDLHALCPKYLGYEYQPQTEIETLFSLHDKLFSELNSAQRHVLEAIEIPLLSILADIQYHGVLIDTTLLAEHGQRLKIELARLEQEAFVLAHRPFNLNSPKQLQEILYNEQQLPILSKTPKGQPSTAESALQELALTYRLPAIILTHRSLNKLVSTYIDALPKCINEQTGRIHTSYNQAVTATGRLSSSDPNLQNIPIRTEEGRLIRRAFIAPKQHILMTADYSQIELRIMAHLSQEPNLLKAFAQNLDIHTATASEIFDTPLINVTKEQRRRAKAVNFGLIYGMSAFGLAKQLGIERHDAQHYIDRYFDRYPGVLQYMDQTREQAHQQGFVDTIFGRRLYLPNINARNMMLRKAAERTAINAPMQGSAADIIKQAMINIAAWQTDTSNTTKTIMQVHDELVFEVHQDDIELTKNAIKDLMEHAVELSVPLLVSIGTGKNWDEAH